ncbi:Disease resistance protein L6 [Linum grandiflorum]
MVLQNWSSFPAVPTMLLLAAAGVVLSLMKKRSETSRSSSTPPSLSSSSLTTVTTQPLPAADYEVFLSFRGPDVRTTFADFLYRFLDNSNIRTFFDDEELRKGEEISESLFKAIEESKVYVPILSPGYASSKWCLQELAHMVKCCKEGNGSILLPIFFMMEPRDVRHQEGSYKKAFRQHDKKYDVETVKEWKGALEEVGRMKGWHVTESDGQGAIVREVFSCVRSHLMSSYLLVTEELVGIDLHIEQVTNLLNQGVRIVGIVGMGGLGKTTIAMAVRDKVYAKFEYCCFLRDVRETLLGREGIVTLQKQILSVIPGFDGNVRDASQGIRVIKDRVCKHRTLIILDDADARFEFEQILGNLEDFSSESRFIITTRNLEILKFFEHCEVYIPDELDHEHSLQLFSRHAFGLSYPPEDRVGLTIEFLKVATGLPLALKVIGSTLNRKNEKFWKEKLKQLRKIPCDKVQERLMISFLDLIHEEQEIFLDIASIFIRKQKEHPIYMWSACDFYPEIGVDALILKSLIKINDKNEFWMHDSIRDLGRAIVREKDPWRGSRIWDNEDVEDILTNEKGTDRLTALRVQIKGGISKLTDRGGICKLTDKQFEKFSGLRYLEVVHGKPEGNFESILPNMRWLQMIGCVSNPIDCDMKKLVIFNLEDSQVRDDWRGWEKIKVARNLKSIRLYNCYSLQRAPDLSQCENLELIDIDFCTEMSGELHIGTLENLKVLKISFTKITDLTGDIGVLQNLQEINVWHSKLRKLPDGISKLPSLVVLHIPKMWKSKNVPTILPTSLERLALSSPCIPNLMDIECLEKLVLHDYQHQFPGDMWRLSKLKILKLSSFRCESLFGEKMDGPCSLPSSLISIEITDSMELERLSNVENLNNLTLLVLRETSVREIHGLEKLRKLETLETREAPNLMNLDGLEHLKLLKKLVLVRCQVLEKLPDLSNLAKLQRMDVSDHTHEIAEIMGLEYLEIGECKSFRVLPSLHDLKNLKTLIIRECEQLVEVVGLENIETLQVLVMCGLSSIRNSLDLSCFKNLLELDISGSTQLTEIVGLEGLEVLKKLSMRGCESIEKLPSLSGLKHVLEIDLSRCRRLTEVVGIEKLESLKILLMVDCESITKLPDLSCLKHLWRLEISGCTQLTGVTGIENLKELTDLEIDERFNIPPRGGL